MRACITVWFLFFACLNQVSGQTIAAPSKLSERVAVRVTNQRIEVVLTLVSKLQGFYFSYGNAVPKDSLVTLNVSGITVRELLDQLFRDRVEYRESGNYIILRAAVHRFSIVPDEILSDDKEYQISGHVIDEETRARVKDASIYERNLLQATLSDAQGNFRLHFKGQHASVILTASKENYRDTSLLFLSSIDIPPKGYTNPVTDGLRTAFNRAGKTFGGFLVSSRQRIQGLNIPDFLARSPFQASFIPGLSSHGMFSSQIVNKASLNVLGGYTAGVNGVEIAGIFNINKHDVEKLQVAGVLNMTGGAVTGVQVAGVMNTVLDSTAGVQVAGVLNTVQRNANGVQVSGLSNQVFENFGGVEVTGLINFVRKSTNGMQIAGLGNITGRKLRGTQIAGLFNYARQMHGLQIGLINVSDTSSGYSIGLFNLVRKGYHKISLSANDVMNLNASLKTGNAKLYTMLIGGMNVSDTAKVYSGGLGLGHDFLLSNRISIATEFSSQFLYLGSWDRANILTKVQSNLQVKVNRFLHIFGGPAYTVYDFDPAAIAVAGYKRNIVPDRHHSYSGYLKGWIGWSAGITVF